MTQIDGHDDGREWIRLDANAVMSAASGRTIAFQFDLCSIRRKLRTRKPRRSPLAECWAGSGINCLGLNLAGWPQTAGTVR